MPKRWIVDNDRTTKLTNKNQRDRRIQAKYARRWTWTWKREKIVRDTAAEWTKQQVNGIKARHSSHRRNDADDAFGCFISIKSHAHNIPNPTHTRTAFRYQIKTTIDIIETNPSIFARCLFFNACIHPLRVRFIPPPSCSYPHLAALCALLHSFGLLS